MLTSVTTATEKMKEKEDIFKSLQNKVEAVAGRKMASPRDFDYLSMRILDKTRHYIAPVTIKRFWGYLGEKRQTKPFRYTLDALALYAGFIDYEAFKRNCLAPEPAQSGFLHNDSLQTTSLQEGARVQLMWHPDRTVIIQYQGMDMFKVVESENSKLSVGDIFICGHIIDGEPLTLRCLIHEGGSPVNYVCGRIDGVKYKLL